MYACMHACMAVCLSVCMIVANHRVDHGTLELTCELWDGTGSGCALIRQSVRCDIEVGSWSRRCDAVAARRAMRPGLSCKAEGVSNKGCVHLIGYQGGGRERERDVCVSMHIYIHIYNR